MQATKAIDVSNLIRKLSLKHTYYFFFLLQVTVKIELRDLVNILQFPPGHLMNQSQVIKGQFAY